MKDTFDKPWHGIGVGGSMALDFANTLDWRLREQPIELLQTLTDVLRWGHSTGTLDRVQARELRAWAASHPRPAARALAESAKIREAIAAIAQSLVRGKAPPTAALGCLEAACRAAWDARVLRFRDGTATWEWRERKPEPLRPAWAAALDAERLLTSPEHRLVRQCGDAECGWFFVDTSRNKSRRWCSMESCGNRNKVRRFYRRARRNRASG